MITPHLLRLDGWLSYRKAKIVLDEPGATWIQGEIGAGKSAIFEAIYYLLFGKTIRKKDSVKSLINRVLDRGYKISLTFSKDGNKYKIKEIRGRPHRGLYFIKNGTSLRGKTDPETRIIILKELDITEDEFKSIAFLGQRQSQILVEGKESERAEAIVDIYGLNRYDELISLCSEDIKKITEERKVLEDTLVRYQEELSNVEESLLSDEYENIECPSDKYLSEINDKVQKLGMKLNRVHSKANIVNKSLGRILAFDKQRAYREDIQDKIKELTKELANLPAPGRALELIKKELNSGEAKTATLEEQLDGLVETIEQARTLKNRCPVNNKKCPIRVPIKHRKKILKTGESRKADLERELKSVQKTIDKLTNEKERCTKHVTLLQSLESNKKALASFPDNTGMPTAEAHERKLRKFQDMISNISAKLNKLQDRRAQITSEIRVAKERMATREKMNKLLEVRESSINKLKDKIKSKGIDLQYASGALAVFKKMKMYKIDLVLQLLNKNLKSILNKISDGEYTAEFTSQKLTADRKKILDKIGITVYDGYKSIPIELCSGGQSTEIGLAVLLSTWVTANSISNKGVSSLWLDEVFGPLNEEIIDRVFDSVINIIKKLGTTSVKVISHRELDTRLFDHFWYVTRTNGISTIKTE